MINPLHCQICRNIRAWAGITTAQSWISKFIICSGTNTYRAKYSVNATWGLSVINNISILCYKLVIDNSWVPKEINITMIARYVLYKIDHVANIYVKTVCHKSTRPPTCLIVLAVAAGNDDLIFQIRTGTRSTGVVRTAQSNRKYWISQSDQTMSRRHVRSELDIDIHHVRRQWREWINNESVAFSHPVRMMTTKFRNETPGMRPAKA